MLRTILPYGHAVVVGHGPRPGETDTDPSAPALRALRASLTLAPVVSLAHARPCEGVYQGAPVEPGTVCPLAPGADPVDLVRLAWGAGRLTGQESVLYLYVHGDVVRSRLVWSAEACPDVAGPMPGDWTVYKGPGEGDHTRVKGPGGVFAFHALP